MKHFEWLRHFLETTEISISSVHMRVLWSMGDSVGVGILMVYYPLRCPSTDELDKILASARYAFESPISISNPLDRNPAVTLCALAALKSLMHSSDDISRTSRVIELLRTVGVTTDGGMGRRE